LEPRWRHLGPSWPHFVASSLFDGLLIDFLSILDQKNQPKNIENQLKIHKKSIPLGTLIAEQFLKDVRFIFNDF